MRRPAALIALLLLAAPSSPRPDERATILIYSGTTGYRHESIEAGVDAVSRLASARGLAVVTSEDPRSFDPASLRSFDSVVLLSSTTKPKDPESEWLVGDRREALRDLLRRGGAIIAIHAAADSHYHWPWYGRMIGARFAHHPEGTPNGMVSVADPGSALAGGLPGSLSRTDEWYYFDDYDPTSKLVLTLDPQSIGQPDVNPNPVAWAREVDGGRVFYTAMGHTTASFSDPYFLRVVGNGIDWALGRWPAGAEK